MNGIKFIEAELTSKCYGDITVLYDNDRQRLYARIGTGIIFRYHKYVTPDIMTDKAALTVLVNDIKLSYINFLLDFYFKTS